MKQFRKYFGVLVTVVLIALFYFLETAYYSDFGCGCSSACTGFYVSAKSKIAGYLILLVSFFLFMTSLGKKLHVKIQSILFFLIVFITVLYGNGLMLFNKGACGQSLNQTSFYLFQKPIGDFAKADGETLYLDSLETNFYRGKLLGYLINNDKFTVYRIGADPLQIPTGFLFWQIDLEQLNKDLAYGLNSYRIPPDSLDDTTIIFIGGQGMPEEAFQRELQTAGEFQFADIADPVLEQHANGTTVYRFHVRRSNPK